MIYNQSYILRLLLCCFLLITACGEDDSTSPNEDGSASPNTSVPKKIIGRDGRNNFITIDIQLETVETSLTPFNVVGQVPTSFAGSQPSGLTDILYFISELNQPQVVRLVTFSSNFEINHEKTLNVETDSYLWSQGFSNENFIVLRGRGIRGDNFQKLVLGVVDRSSDMFSLIDVCSDCSWSLSSFNPYLLTDDKFFVLNESNGWLFTGIDLTTSETVFSANLESYPEMLIGESNIYLKSERTKLAIHDRVSFTKTDEFEFPYQLDIGLSSMQNEKAVVFQPTAQPFPISQVDIVYDFNSNQVLQEFSYERLLSLQEEFDAELGLVSGGVPTPHIVDTDREFVLFLLSIPTSIGNQEAHYVYSNYNGSFLGHIVVPDGISSIYTLVW